MDVPGKAATGAGLCDGKRPKACDEHEDKSRFPWHVILLPLIGRGAMAKGYHASLYAVAAVR
jgi:hypothetical protein